MNDLGFIRFGNNDERRCVLHALDVAKKSLTGTVATTAFLNLREQKLIETALLSDGSFCFAFFGGHIDAERRLLICFPDYAADISELKRGCNPSDSEYIVTACRYWAGDRIGLYRISGGTKFDKQLTHRDYLGALLALGIERSAVGDIAVSNGKAYFFLLDHLGSYVIDKLEAVGNVAVKVDKIDTDTEINLSANTVEGNCVVTSLRLDCVLSALTGVSRDTAKALIQSNRCEHNYSNNTKPDTNVNPGDIISARGYGKFRIAKDFEPVLTKKGKYRVNYFKYK